MATCTHLDTIRITDLPEAVDGCIDCLAIGDPWVHLRICLACGHVGCCDSSPNKHASAHFVASEHALIRSLQPGEDWSWCFADQAMMIIPDIRGTTAVAAGRLTGRVGSDRLVEEAGEVVVLGIQGCRAGGEVGDGDRGPKSTRVRRLVLDREARHRDLN